MTKVSDCFSALSPQGRKIPFLKGSTREQKISPMPDSAEMPAPVRITIFSDDLFTLTIVMKKRIFCKENLLKNKLEDVIIYVGGC